RRAEENLFDPALMPSAAADISSINSSAQHIQRQKLHEITSLYNGRTGTGFATAARRGRIALLLILFDRNPCVLTRLEIGANYEKDREFLNADCRFGSLRNLSCHSF